jgi:hypothetical protein
MVPTQKPQTCPKCQKDDQVIPILYGYPAGKMRMPGLVGEFKFGGCAIHPEMPAWYCKACDHEFGALASQPDYREMFEWILNYKDSSEST